MCSSVPALDDLGADCLDGLQISAPQELKNKCRNLLQHSSDQIGLLLLPRLMCLVLTDAGWAQARDGASARAFAFPDVHKMSKLKLMIFSHIQAVHELSICECGFLKIPSKGLRLVQMLKWGILLRKKLHLNIAHDMPISLTWRLHNFSQIVLNIWTYIEPRCSGRSGLNEAMQNWGLIWMHPWSRRLEATNWNDAGPWLISTAAR